MGSLDGKRALVTGGGSGIGLATARRLTEEGARVAIVDVNAEAAERAASDVGGVAISQDMSRSDGVGRAFEQAVGELGGLDIAHLNAGVTTGEGDIARLTDDQYERIRGINLDGVVFGVREAVRRMETSGGGTIVCTASLAGMVAYPGDPIYALTKHGVVGFVRGLGPALEGRGITIAAVCPGIVETPLVGADNVQKLKEAGFPLIKADDIAEAVFRAVTTGQSGACWVIQPGRDPLVYEFKGVPGPRTPEGQGMRPPVFDG